MAATVALSGNSLVIISDGRTYNTGVTVSKGESLASVRAKIGAAVSSARSQAKKQVRAAVDSNNDAEINVLQGVVRGIDGLNVGAAAGKIHSQLAARKEEAPAAPPNPKKEAPKPKEEVPKAPEPRVAVRPVQRIEPKPKPAPKPAAKPEEKMKATPRIEPSIEWIEEQLGDAASRNDKTAQQAASNLRLYSGFVDQFLEAGVRRGGQRTEKQQAATTAVFDALYQIPRFRLYLTSQAAERPEFSVLEGLLTEKGEGKSLRGRIAAYVEDPSAFPEFTALLKSLMPGRKEISKEEAVIAIVRAADFYVRHYLLTFEAREEGAMGKYREEVLQLPGTRWRMERSEEKVSPEKEAEMGKETRIIFKRLYLGGPMESGTLISAALYLRRWHQEHPKVGTGKTQDRIESWQAPEPIEIQKKKAEAPIDYTKELERYAPALKKPNIGIIGASVTAGPYIQRELERVLKEDRPAAKVRAYGKEGQSSRDFLKRFERDIIRHRHNIVVISGYARVNETGSLERIKKNFEAMIKRAKEKGLMIVVFGTGPYAAYRQGQGWSKKAQERSDEFNAWLKGNKDIIYVDISAIGEGDPPTLKKRYDSGDGLHPNVAGRNRIARLIAMTLYSTPKKKMKIRKSPVEKYAKEHWQNIEEKFYKAVKSGDPKALVDIVRAFPEKLRRSLSPALQSFEGAFRYAGIHDIERTYDKVYNDFVGKDKEFVEFASNHDRYKKIVGVEIGPDTPKVTRTRAIEAMKAFVIHKAGEDKTFEADLEMLARQVFRATRLTPDGSREDMFALAAIALYEWRRNNEKVEPKDSNYWARGIKGVKLPRPETPEVTEAPKRKRRPIRIFGR